MVTKLFRHFDELGNELPPTYITISNEELDAELEAQAEKEAIAEITAKKKAEIIARKS